MNPTSANPSLHEYSLFEKLNISPDLLEDQYAELPTRLDILKWLFFGKPLKFRWRKGLENRKGEEYLIILDTVRSQQEEEQKEIEQKLTGTGVS
jgi:hypothetical protein